MDALAVHSAAHYNSQMREYPMSPHVYLDKLSSLPQVQVPIYCTPHWQSAALMLTTNSVDMEGALSGLGRCQHSALWLYQCKF